MELAVAVQSIPPEWYDDDRMAMTILDVLQRNAERIKKRR